MIYYNKNGVDKTIDYKLEVLGQEFTTLDYMDIVESKSEKIDIKDCRATVSGITVKLHNDDEFVSRWLMPVLDGLKDKKASIYYRVNGGVWTILRVGIVSAVNSDSYNTYYQIEIEDIKRKIEDITLFANELQTGDYISSGLPSALDYNFILENVVIDSKTVKRLRYEGHPIDFAIDIFKCIFGDTEYLNYIDLTTFDKNLFDDTLEFQFLFYEALEDVSSYLVRQVYEAMNVYQAVNSEGKLYLIKRKQPVADDFFLPQNIIINEEDIVKVNENKPNYENIVNYILVYYDYDFYNKEYAKAKLFIDDESVLNYGLQPSSPKKIYFQGLNLLSSLQQDNFIDSFKNNFFEKFADQKQSLSIDVFIDREFEVGEYYILEHSKLINWEHNENSVPGERGITANVVKFDNYGVMIDNSLSYGNKWADYIGAEENNSIGFLEGEQLVKVDRVMHLAFFQDLLERIRYNKAYLEAQDRW